MKLCEELRNYWLCVGRCRLAKHMTKLIRRLKPDIKKKKMEMLEQEFLGFKIISGGFPKKLQLGAILCVVIVNDPDPGTKRS